MSTRTQSLSHCHKTMAALLHSVVVVLLCTQIQFCSSIERYFLSDGRRLGLVETEGRARSCAFWGNGYMISLLLDEAARTSKEVRQVEKKELSEMIRSCWKTTDFYKGQQLADEAEGWVRQRVFEDRVKKQGVVMNLTTDYTNNHPGYSTDSVDSTSTTSSDFTVFVRRQLPRSLPGAVYVGTLWCGLDDIAESTSDLGTYNQIDYCCREHDYCDDIISWGTCNHGLCNYNPIPNQNSNCECDSYFNYCLSSVDGDQADLACVLGHTFFNIINQRCFTTSDNGSSYHYTTTPFSCDKNTVETTGLTTSTLLPRASAQSAATPSSSTVPVADRLFKFDLALD